MVHFGVSGVPMEEILAERADAQRVNRRCASIWTVFERSLTKEGTVELQTFRSYVDHEHSG